jgi:hypothetical protein
MSRTRLVCQSQTSDNEEGIGRKRDMPINETINYGEAAIILRRLAGLDRYAVIATKHLPRSFRYLMYVCMYVHTEDIRAVQANLPAYS